MYLLRPCLVLALSGLGATLGGQVPGAWNSHLQLGQDEAAEAPWFGYGLWAADHHGPAAQLVDSLGLGNAITGFGFHVEGGVKLGRWDLAAEGLGIRNADNSRMSLYRAHAVWRSRPENGWSLGLEQEPLVWGYGLNGGYVLGEAARPFPKIRVESTMKELRPFGIPLGAWGLQAFMGRMESERVMSPLLQDPLRKEESREGRGDPQGPLLNGYRVQARFGPFLEFYANYINLWGGSIRGVGLTQGYSGVEYATAMFGLKDTIAEANLNSSTIYGEIPNKNKALSASELDWGLRLRLWKLERPLGAESIYFYLSRGSKNEWWNIGTFLRNPVRGSLLDLEADGRRLVQGRITRIWNATDRYSAPNLTSPNDTIGLLFDWSKVRLGLEYLDAINAFGPGVRSFGHYVFLSGFYYYGDPLGNALGGEARTTTLRLEADLADSIESQTFLHVGERVNRDPIDLWQQAHPGTLPTRNRFVGVQQGFNFKVSRGITMGLSAYWQNQSAVDFMTGARGNAFRWFADVAYRWHAQHPGQ